MVEVAQGCLRGPLKPPSIVRVIVAFAYLDVELVRDHPAGAPIVVRIARPEVVRDGGELALSKGSMQGFPDDFDISWAR